MSNRSNRQKPIRRIRKLAGRSRYWLTVPCAVFMATAGAVSSQQAVTPYVGHDGQLKTNPEVLIAPLQFNGGLGSSDGWIIVYRNTLTGPEAPDLERQSRDVVHADPHSPHHIATVAWEILRTSNKTCNETGAGPCPDRIRILSVPEGYQAMPETAWVDEGAILSIRVVPAPLG